MIRLAAAAIFLASPALAEVAEISSCEVDKIGAREIVYCTVKNTSQQAIASIKTRGFIQTPNREVPWLDFDWKASISGGIEPQESVRALLFPVHIDNRADGLPIELLLAEVQLFDVSEDRIGVINNLDPLPLQRLDGGLEKPLEKALNP